VKQYTLFEHPVSKPKVVVAGFSWKAFWLNVVFFLYHKRFGAALLCICLNSVAVLIVYAVEQNAYSNFKENHSNWRIYEDFAQSLIDDLRENGHKRSMGDFKNYEIVMNAQERKAVSIIEREWHTSKRVPFIIAEVLGVFLVGLVFALKQDSILIKGLLSRGFKETFRADSETEEMFWAKYTEHKNSAGQDDA